ncbi:unnamed protein product [Candidula unifasciata]|uniref:Triple QxxK/R motif-containing protein n=1 Tax=Candidula unifasciata TaxID=100452 RepID=A0A8S3ZLB6_9EUPU|nr:unnamed protein product [Candidula unifasciata]
MGRKDTTAQQSQPLDQYRKQIGKQDWKKSKKDVKSMKQKAAETNEFTPQNILLIIGLIVTVLSGLYMLLVWHLGVTPAGDVKDKAHV